MRPRRLIQCTTVGLAGLMIGCGDDDGKTTTTEEWVTAADAICAEMNTQLEQIPEPQTIEEFATAHAQVNQIWRNGLDELQELDLPDGNEAATTEVLDAFDQLIDVSLQWSDAFIAAGFPKGKPFDWDRETGEVFPPKGEKTYIYAEWKDEKGNVTRGNRAATSGTANSPGTRGERTRVLIGDANGLLVDGTATRIPAENSDPASGDDWMKGSEASRILSAAGP